MGVLDLGRRGQHSPNVQGEKIGVGVKAELERALADADALKDHLRLLTEQQRQRRSWWRFGK